MNLKIKNNCLICIFLSLLMSCEKEAKNTSELIIKTDDKEIKLAHIIRPIDGMILWKNKRDTVKVSEKGIFKYEFKITSPEFIRVWVGDNYLKMIVQKNQKYEIDLTDSIKTFYGNNAKGNHYLNSTKRPYNGTFEVDRMFINDTTASLISKKVESMKRIEIKKLNSLHSDKEIDQNFYVLFKNEIDYYYADKIMNLIPYGADIPNDLKQLFIKTIEKYPIETDILPINWTDYADTIIYKIIGDTLTQKEIDKKISDNTYNEFKKDIIEDKFKGNHCEKLLAHQIIFSSEQKNYNKSLINIFDNFKSRYPNSKYLEYLKPGINEIKHYHKKIKRDLPEAVKIIESKNINSFKELLSKFKGQKLYVDIMSTWCGPCKREFKYNKELSKLLEEHNFKKLYISIDDSDKENKWLEMINYYDLEGFHFLSNKKFKHDFAEKYTQNQGYFSIPQYIIINEKGQIIDKNAPRPSEYDKLEKALVGS